MARIGVLGGTFDPPHLAHLAVAEEVREEAGLEEVVFVPARIPPHKHADELVDAELRLELVRAAIRGNPRFRVSDIELRREGPSYTVDTVDELQRERGPGTEIFLIVGADNVHELAGWKDPAALVTKCTILIATRPGFDVPALPDFLSGHARVVAVSSLGISSTEIRRRLRAGRSVRYLVPGGVLEAIESRALYRG